MSYDLQGRNAVVFGVANKRSIAWSIAQGLHAAGMKLAITYQNERLEQEARDLILSLPGAEGYMCDVSKDEEIARLFATLKERYGKLHVLVHSVAYAPADELKGDFVNTSREGFRIALDVSGLAFITLVTRSIDLDDETSLETYEVCNDVSQYDLPLKLRALASPIADSPPNEGFGLNSVSAPIRARIGA